MRASHRLLSLGAAVAVLAAVGASVAQEQAATPPQEAGAAPPPSGVLNATGDGLSAAPPDEASPPPAPPEPSQAAAAPAPPAAPPVPPPPPPPEPLKRPRFQTAVLQAVDKVTAETLRFEARVGEPVRYKGLVITLRACEQPAADEAQTDSLGYVEVVSQPPAVPGRPMISARQVFSGWMTAGSPGLNPLQSPGYDVWVIACKTPAPPAPGQA